MRSSIRAQSPVNNPARGPQGDSTGERSMTAVKERLTEIDRDVELPVEPPEEMLSTVRRHIRL